MARILIVDDERGIRSALREILEDERYEVSEAEDAAAGLEEMRKQAFDLVFLDVMLPKMGGIEALEKIREERPETEVVMISGHSTIETAVRAVKLGAFDFLEKPLSLEKILTVTRNALSLVTLREENRGLKKAGLEDLIGVSPELEKVRSLIRTAAASDARILITGENGSGKEVAARAVHRLSKRAAAPFVAVNCAAIPNTLIESELFGHEKGAFTDALSARKGRFELASGGTLFLDEIGDMSLSAQAKVLRAVQEQKIERVGSEKSLTVDVRIVAATNKNLEAECEAGRFRQDLYFRLNVVRIYMPALRERKDDILPLLKHFLRLADAQTQDFDKDAASALLEYPWPGNIRELKNMAERIAILCDGETLSLTALKTLFQDARFAPGKTTGKETVSCAGDGGALCANILAADYTRAKDMFEKGYLESQYEKAGGNVPRMAREIGMTSSNLYVKLRKYGIGGEGKS